MAPKIERRRSRAFSSNGDTDKFANIDHDVFHTGAPALSDGLTWFDCTVHRVDAGDPMVLFGRVEAFAATSLKPLAFCRGQYAEVKAPRPSLRTVKG
ncbi:flavin reductase family protein [Methylocapsa sp. S129]|uniref:flavin reductase family protein n=1 Tax=Methylocapsa sp. S129 TaxID=1641869 RepID=UPI00131D459C|nr:flavin reductase family protein [Methylocapsa sp. S129]